MLKILKDPVFKLALIASAALHIFWLSVVTIVVTPKESRPVKFSKVSFLGPISERAGLDVGIEPRERSLLEKKYLSDIKWRSSFEAVAREFADIPKKGTDISKEGRLVSLIEDAVGSPKLEPIYIAQ